MSEHRIDLSWQRNTSDFTYETYDRTHTVTFEGGSKIQTSSAATYLGNAALPNPEELLIAAVSSCFMLTFLAIAAKSKFIIDQYQDQATGILDKNPEGKLAITHIELNPKINFGGNKKPDDKTLQQMLQKSHAHCFITNSVKAEVKINS